MTWLRWISACIIALSFQLPSRALTPNSPTQDTTRTAALTDDLQHAIHSTDAQTQLPIIITLRDQADLNAPLPLIGKRANLIVGNLQSVADESQSALRAFLSRADIAAEISGIRSFWIFNGVALRATPSVIARLAARGDIEQIDLDHTRHYAQPITTPTPFRADPLAAEVVSAREAGSVEWGVQRIGADRVWSAFGIDGKNVTIGIVDSGADWQHPALRANYRGYDARGFGAHDHLHSWFDATPDGTLYPVDYNQHGTHATGIAVGASGVGVAPGAKWIAARGFDRFDTALDSWLIAALQWMLAPGGDPSYAPQIVSNSWGDDDGTLRVFEKSVAALRAAGIFVVFSAGNAGPKEQTVGSPASLPNVIAIGATDQDDEVTFFSSRGPSPFGDLKPTLSAPGLRIISTIPGGGYAALSGTSMAAPHVAGAAALMLSANPSLSVDAILKTMTRTAQVSTTVPNNAIGWGRLDAYRAALSVIGDIGAISGVVAHNGQPVSGVRVIATSDTREAYALSDVNGAFTIAVTPGVYALHTSAFGYADSYSVARLIQQNKTTTINLNITPLGSGVVRGIVTDATSGAQLNAAVRAIGTPRTSASNANCFPCRYYLDLPSNEYVIEARLTGYRVQTRTVTVADGTTSDVNFALQPMQRVLLVDSGAWYYGSVTQYYRDALDQNAVSYDELRIKQLPRDAVTTTQLLPYDTIIWSSPKDSPASTGASNAISETLAAGRNLILSGQDVAYLDGGGPFGFIPYFKKINAFFGIDNAPTRAVRGGANGAFAGVTLNLNGGDGANNQVAPDIVSIGNKEIGSVIANYDGGNLPASIYTAPCVNYRALYLAFGFEAIDTRAARANAMQRMLNQMQTPRPTAGLVVTPLTDPATGDAIARAGDVITHAFRIRHTGDGGVTETFKIALNGNAWQTQIVSDTSQITLAPCESRVITLTTTIPTNTPRSARDVVNVTITPDHWQGVNSTISFGSKTPAGILLVDDERFSHSEQAYLNALAPHGAVDRWDTRADQNSTQYAEPTLDALSMYPLVVWFNGYDWFKPLTPNEKTVMRDYVLRGGGLWFSSQAALQYSEGDDIDRNIFGVAAINFDDITSDTVRAPNASVPTHIGSHNVSGSLLPFPYNWNLSSAVLPMPNTQVILRGDSGQPFGLAAEVNGARSVLLPFAYEALTTTARADLMDASLAWLTPLARQASFTANNASSKVEYLFDLVADDALQRLLGESSTRVMISITLPNGLTLIDATAPSEALGGGWTGTLHVGDALHWRVTGVAAKTTAITAIAHIRLPDYGIQIDKPVVARTSASPLAVSIASSPDSPAWSSRASMTVNVTNTSNADMTRITLMDAVPFVTRLLTDTVRLDGGGLIDVDGNRIRWSGDLRAGAAITMTYVITTPKFGVGVPLAIYHAAIVTDADDNQTQADLWMTPTMRRVQLPLIAVSQ